MVELIWCEVLLVLLLVTFSTSFPFSYGFSLIISKMVPKHVAVQFCFSVSLHFFVSALKNAVRCQFFFLFFLCPGKQISELSLGDGDEDLDCCLLSYAVACPRQKRSLPALVCSALSAGSCFQPKGNPHYFMVHVREVLEKLSAVFLTLYFALKLLIFRYPQGRGKG